MMQDRKLKFPISRWVRMALGSRRAITDSMTEMVFNTSLLDYEGRMTRVDQGQAYKQLERVAVAVAGYQAKHGEYPETLEPLSSDWLESIPRDPFDPDGGHIRYSREDNRVVICSIGQNMEDDGGSNDFSVEGAKLDVIIEWER